MYKILKSTDQGLDELELEHLEKGYWLDIVAPSVEELQEIAAATKIQMDFLSAALDEEEKSRIEVEDDQILILVDIPFLRSNKDYDTLPLGIVVTEEGIENEASAVSEKAHSPIAFKLSPPNVTNVNLLQYLKAPSPIVATENGIITE